MTTSRLHRLAEAIALLGVLFTAAGLAGRTLWFFDLFTHFKLQLAACFLAYAVLEFAARHHRHAWASLAFCAINAFPAALLFLPAGTHASATLPPSTTRLRILQANILTCNTNSPALLKLVASEAPDVIVLEEPDERWLRELAPLTAVYPVTASEPREDNLGIAVFCKTNAQAVEVFHLDDPEHVPSVRARITADGRTLTVVGTHALAPYNDDMWQGRNHYTLALARRLQKIEGPLVVTGDFNNTPWSSHIHEFLDISGLCDSSQGRGPLPTWPAYSPAWARIPIDHCFYSPEVTVLSKRPGPNIGSDHLPLLIDVTF